MTSQATFLFASVHIGPYLSVQPLEGELGTEKVSYLVEGPSMEDRARQGLTYLSLPQVQAGWASIESFLQTTGVKAVIRSTSENVVDQNVEVLASVAASNLGLPVFVIEDFPGNYWPGPGERLDGLFVEDVSLRELHRSRGIDSRVIQATGNPRYSSLGSVDVEYRRKKTRQGLGMAEERVMLWAGQPDGDNSYLALERILSEFNDDQVTLLFRAHPRDEAYTAGKYLKLLQATPMNYIDVSHHSNMVSLCCASDLLVTQFSSAGVEASYLGIPALFVLFDDLGKQYLRSYKGYDRLPWCEDRCAFLIQQSQDVKYVMEEALFDSLARNEVRYNFRERFANRTDCAASIAHQIVESVNQINDRRKEIEASKPGAL